MRRGDRESLLVGLDASRCNNGRCFVCCVVIAARCLASIGGGFSLQSRRDGFCRGAGGCEGGGWCVSSFRGWVLGVFCCDGWVINIY